MGLGDLEREVMTQLWSSATPLSVRQVLDRMTGHRDHAYTTIMTVLDRLAKKGLVGRRLDGRAYLYFPSQTRAELTVEVMMDALHDTPDRDAALAHFVSKLTPDELAAAVERARNDG